MTAETFDNVAAEGGNRTRIVAFGALGAVVLGAGGYFLLSGGGDDAATEAFVAPKGKPKVVAAKPATNAKPAAKPAQLPAATSVRLGRDPFLALYIEPKGAPAEGAAVPPTTTTPVGTGTTGTTTGTTGSTATPTERYTLTLKSVSGTSELRKYVFVYGGASHTVVTGQKFGKYGELVVLGMTTKNGSIVTGALIQVGDDDPVTIDLGEKLTVL